ncbi:M15 family metallopeptidase [Lutimonas zeaxanthinifaciens]|uniref:M15 family metallopeptidase n=1 Tax=Lutimonas zeaxanthinifaciens TaxID=3060215 RepID=UPI00265CD961|nr:M15 family metallopeptidase [Lutimonas sp. YSD2104]WKK66947.1 M15 family metallopeptidase [Lutimonas sp. YSD2104]
MKLNIILKSLAVIALLSFTTLGQTSTDRPPSKEDFVDLKEIMPNLRSDLRYYGDNNFVGRPIKGYKEPKCLLTKEAAYALKKVQDELERLGFGLLVYDAYRPQQATNDFVQWAEDVSDNLMKPQFYPNVEKKDLFAKGYISVKSGHSRGSTVDVTIVSLKTKQILNMGSPYDLFDEVSATDHTASITKNQHSLRLLLKRRMEKHGWQSYPKEWWHFTLKDEPFPNTYFDFPIE